MSVQLTQSDFNRLAGLLAALPDFRTPDSRLDFLDGIFAGSPRRDDILGQINVSGTPRGVAIRVINTLTRFGQDEPGQETLGVLVNTLLSYIGSGEDADFLRTLFTRYPLQGEPLATRGLDQWRGSESPSGVQEKIIGENTLHDIRILELALDASQAVVRIRTASELGSGFLVGPGLVMTNNHVINTAHEAVQSMFTFNYQLDRLLQPAQIRTVVALLNGCFYTNSDLDFTIVEIEDAPGNAQPLTLSRQRLRRDERVNIIQHPGGHYKKVSMQNNFVAYADARDIQYLTSTEPGSSGSPVFNNDFVVVGIHHSGGRLLEPGSNHRYLRNAGSSMAAVLDDLRDNAPGIYEQLRVQ